MMIMGKEVPKLPESPQAKFWAWVVGIVLGTVAALFALYSFFMPRAEATDKLAGQQEQITKFILLHNEQIAQLNTAQRLQLETVQMQIEYSADQNAKRMIDNQLFQLEQIPPSQLRPQDRALYSKLLRDRQELVNLWNRRGRPLR